MYVCVGNIWGYLGIKWIYEDRCGKENIVEEIMKWDYRRVVKLVFRWIEFIEV